MDKLLYKDSVNTKDYEKQKAEVNKYIKSIAKKYKNVQVIDPKSYLCDKDKCLIGTSKVSYYSNSGHITPEGAMQVMPLFEPIFKAIK